ncbi:MAG: hypothetical protein BroJett015_19560 [Chloroflexota bacterium]|nr:hypothetical protein [Ardenticatenaceae bacterium]GIK56293.1 MAG: hypothetical protein BroJett015_19560 [Chloroflexota bacterium]
MQTGCHCFGSSQRPVSAADVWRNIGLMLAAGAGLWAATMAGDAHASLTWGELLFIAIPAGVFVLVWANLRDIVALFQTA